MERLEANYFTGVSEDGQICLDLQITGQPRWTLFFTPERAQELGVNLIKLSHQRKRINAANKEARKKDGQDNSSAQTGP